MDLANQRTTQRVITYQLTDDDWNTANQMVQVRARTSPYKESAEIEGAAAEVAFARVFGLAVPDPVYKKGDGGVDYTLPSGALVDVKAISGPQQHRLGLLVPKRTRSGIYVLVHINFEDQTATILGYQTGGFAASRGQDKNDHWRIHQRDLLPAGDLYRHMNWGKDGTNIDG